MRTSRLLPVLPLPVLALACLPATAAAAEAFEGLWAPDINWCVNEDDDGNPSIPYEIRNGRMTGYTFICDLTSVAAVGSAGTAWLIDMSCRGGERSGEHQAIFAVSPPGHDPDAGPERLVEVLLGGPEVNQYVHCDPILH